MSLLIPDQEVRPEPIVCEPEPEPVIEIDGRVFLCKEVDQESLDFNLEVYVDYLSVKVAACNSWASCSDDTCSTTESFPGDIPNLEISNDSFIDDKKFLEISEEICDPSFVEIDVPLQKIVSEFTVDDECVEHISDRFDTLIPEYEQVSRDNGVFSCWSLSFDNEEPYIPKFVPKDVVAHCDPSVIQDAVNDIFPYHHLVDDKYFQAWVEASDISLEVSKCWLDLSNFKDPLKGSQCYAEPLFQTGATSRRINTQRETLLAAKKRNMNIPELAQIFDMEREREVCFQRFLLNVVDKTRLGKLEPMMTTEVKFFNDYLVGKNPPLSEYQGPLNLCSLDKYMHMVKTTIKPVEDNSLIHERPLCATITYHKKGIVMQSSPIFLAAMSRLFFVLKSKILIPSGKFHQLFNLDPLSFESARWFKEVDFSKFDKSQGELHHLVQKDIFMALGLPPDFVDVWFSSHERSHIVDRDTGVGFSVNYQRRTGDAVTYLGNTIVTLICLARVYDLNSSDITFVVASGDDSLIGSLHELPRDSESLFVSLFNFEAKFPHNQPFICSKFLVAVDVEGGRREVISVPNPAKLLIRMGKKDCQYQDLGELFISWLDVVKYFRDSEVCRKVADLCAYRQKRGPSMYLEAALLALPVCFSNRKKFLNICYSLTNDDCLKYSDLRIKKKKSDDYQTHLKQNDDYRSRKQDRRYRAMCAPWFGKIFQEGTVCDEKRTHTHSFHSQSDHYRSICGRSPTVVSSTDGNRECRGSREAGSYGRENSRLKYRPRDRGVHQSSRFDPNSVPPNSR
ncbi:polymerase [Lilac ring mottle virus]|uniref:RNA-directed RNA polymerase 2a n=1 Tax=Lilac ring mottle virus TaxID=37125 RepID=B7T2J4_9BROM|nr:polymerase [Lilac ring mottle virus]ACJ68815.1 polymerase [Lilac ring mottle virus]